MDTMYMLPCGIALRYPAMTRTVNALSPPTDMSLYVTAGSMTHCCSLSFASSIRESYVVSLALDRTSSMIEFPLVPAQYGAGLQSFLM